VRVVEPAAELAGKTQFTQAYRVASATSGRVCAEGEATTVVYDYSALKRAPIPAPVLDGIAAVQRIVAAGGDHRLDTAWGEPPGK
jgi:acyl-CoA thioesterase FadM